MGNDINDVDIDLEIDHKHLYISCGQLIVNPVDSNKKILNGVGRRIKLTPIYAP